MQHVTCTSHTFLFWQVSNNQDTKGHGQSTCLPGTIIENYSLIFKFANLKIPNFWMEVMQVLIKTRMTESGVANF